MVRDFSFLEPSIHHRTHYPLQIGDQRLSVFRYVKLYDTIAVLFAADVRKKVEGVVPTGSKKDGGADLSVLAMLGQFIGKVNEFVDKPEEFWRVWHVLSPNVKLARKCKRVFKRWHLVAHQSTIV